MFHLTFSNYIRWFREGLADMASLKKKDVITALGPTSVVGPADFELALFRARKLPSIPLTIHRQDASTLTIDLPTGIQAPPAE